MTSTSPIGIRNNNPGNLRYTPGNAWLGQIGQVNGFCQFDTPANGLRALCKNLLTYQLDRRGIPPARTLEAIITRWAPPSENDTGAYIAAVVKEVGVAATTPIDLWSSPALLATLAEAIVRHENGQQPYDQATIRAQAARALGIQAPTVERLTDIPAGDVDTLRARFARGSPKPKTVVTEKQPDGSYVLTATYA